MSLDVSRLFFFLIALKMKTTWHLRPGDIISSFPYSFEAFRARRVIGHQWYADPCLTSADNFSKRSLHPLSSGTCKTWRVTVLRKSPVWPEIHAGTQGDKARRDLPEFTA
ncbi:hypothetical protein ETB97_012744 [Aspergillus alliaceus]|uniref:Uncharacterized protein n=1 Tax=Petromyces alliaceus TaxID=209559 RepID=A0A8H6A6I0_PETAA|nr:hypothetical protein ETB97_012744 [Aspergillus burnettii]